MDDDAAVDYAGAIERFIVLVSGRGLFLSGKDKALLERWHHRGVPLETACRALAGAFARFREEQGPRPRWPRSLKYFEPAVLAAVEERRQLGPELTVNTPGAPDDRQDSSTSTSTSTSTSATRVQQGVSYELDLMQELRTIASVETDPRRRDAWRVALGVAEGIVKGEESEGRDEVLERVDAALAEAFIDRLEPDERASLDAAVDERLRPESARLGTLGRIARRRVMLRDELETRFRVFRLGVSGGSGSDVGS